MRPSPLRWETQNRPFFHHELMMANTCAHEVTALLLAWREGDAAALDRLVPLVYDELRRMARRRVRRASAGQPLQATALVHELFLRIVDADSLTLKSRTHFFALSARMMRQILVDQARRNRADKRGGCATMISLDEALPAATPASSVDVLALDEALEALSLLDARQCRVVELRFFAGLNIPEAADALGVSTATIEREWAMAKAWLLRRLSTPPDPPPDRMARR
jgi:RNA polymerase sigma factor (TIGR02999 family)